MDCEVINGNHERARQRERDEAIQQEIRIAKQLQQQTNCTWDDALRAARTVRSASRS